MVALLQPYERVNNVKKNKLSTTMDLNFKIKIDQLISEVSALTDLTTKIAVLNYIQQESGFLLWQLEDEQRIDEDSRDY